MHTTFEVQTRGAGLYEITDRVRHWLAGDGPSGGVRSGGIRRVDSGLLTLFIRHTSASLLIQENADPEVQTDLVAFFHRLVPPSDHPSMAWMTHTYEGPDDMPAHVKAALLPTSVQIPIFDGQLQLGTWQGLYLFEHRAAPHRRQVAALFQGTPAAPF